MYALGEIIDNENTRRPGPTGDFVGGAKIMVINHEEIYPVGPSLLHRLDTVAAEFDDFMRHR